MSEQVVVFYHTRNNPCNGPALLSYDLDLGRRDELMFFDGSAVDVTNDVLCETCGIPILAKDLAPNKYVDYTIFDGTYIEYKNEYDRRNHIEQRYPSPFDGYYYWEGAKIPDTTLLEKNVDIRKLELISKILEKAPEHIRKKLKDEILNNLLKGIT